MRAVTLRQALPIDCLKLLRLATDGAGCQTHMGASELLGGGRGGDGTQSMDVGPLLPEFLESTYLGWSLRIYVSKSP